jgi:hypothetical protein
MSHEPDKLLMLYLAVRVHWVSNLCNLRNLWIVH